MSDSLTAAELAAHLGVARTWVDVRVRRREIPHLRLGRYVKFTPAHVAAIEAQYAVAPKAANPLAPTERSQSRNRTA